MDNKVLEEQFLMNQLTVMSALSSLLMVKTPFTKNDEVVIKNLQKCGGLTAALILQKTGTTIQLECHNCKAHIFVDGSKSPQIIKCPSCGMEKEWKKEDKNA